MNVTATCSTFTLEMLSTTRSSKVLQSPLIVKLNHSKLHQSSSRHKTHHASSFKLPQTWHQLCKVIRRARTQRISTSLAVKKTLGWSCCSHLNLNLIESKGEPLLFAALARLPKLLQFMMMGLMEGSKLRWRQAVLDTASRVMKSTKTYPKAKTWSCLPSDCKWPKKPY